MSCMAAWVMRSNRGIARFDAVRVACVVLGSQGATAATGLPRLQCTPRPASCPGAAHTAARCPQQACPPSLRQREAFCLQAC